MSKVLVIPDLQAPFQHPKALDHLKRIRDKYKINYGAEKDYVVCIGDEVDFKFLKYQTVNDESAYVQHFKALKFLKKLYIEFPDVLVCESNHVKERMVFAAECANIPEFLLPEIGDVLQSPKGWRRGYEWFIDNVMYVHGHRVPKNLKSAVDLHHSSIVFGHHAKAGIEWFTKNNLKTKNLDFYFGACVGALTVNPLGRARASYGMKYSLKYANAMPVGCLVIIDGIPIYEPLFE